MHFLKQLRFVAALLAAFFVLSLTACGSGSNSFTWFVDSIPANLDPQVASSASDIIACENLYSGLVRRTPDGSLAPELCERWEVSADRLTYTFYLKDGLTYTASKGDPSDYAITAEDFVFAFQRMFLPGTNSPYAVEFSALENSAAVLAGQKPASALGVTAAEPLKLVFRLSSPDETFLSKLTLPGAMPCDEAFFDSTRGTYGLTSASTLSSGHFYLYNWTSSGLFLRRAASGSQIDSLRLVENTTSSGQSAEELINNEKCTAALDDSGTPTSLQSVSYSDTTWALLFNCDSIFASTELRQALGSAAASAVEVPGGGLFAEAKGLIPDGLTVDGKVGPATMEALGIAEGGESEASGTTDNELALLARLISAEARGEPYAGQVAVGAVVLNRVEHPSFPNTISEVIFQPGAFSCMLDGQWDEPVADSAYQAARDALAGADPSGGAIYYFNPVTATNAWIWSRPEIITIGKHRFCA